MPQEKEPIKDIVITGTDAEFVHRLFRYESHMDFRDALEKLFESALWGLAHNGGEGSTTPNEDIAAFSYHYESMREVIKLLKIVDEAATEKGNQQKL